MWLFVDCLINNTIRKPFCFSFSYSPVIVIACVILISVCGRLFFCGWNFDDFLINFAFFEKILALSLIFLEEYSYFVRKYKWSKFWVEGSVVMPSMILITPSIFQCRNKVLDYRLRIRLSLFQWIRRIDQYYILWFNHNFCGQQFSTNIKFIALLMSL